jgi:tetratricopeptide (TPR) repeat protein
VVARQPDVRVPAPPATPAVAPPANAYPFDEVFKALRESEADLKSGRFAEARERLNKYEPSRMIDKQQKEFVSLRDRCELQFNLLRETNITPSREPPKLSTIEFKVPKGPFTGTITAKDAKKVEMLLLSNISVTFDMFEVLQITEVDALRAKRMVEAEVARREKQVRPGRPMDAFRVAEFCLRNGQMDRVSEFFDRASQMASQSGADLIGTVRDEKAAGLYDTFVFFMSIGNLQEARSTLDLLRLRYPQSPLNEQAKALEEETTRVAMETLRRDIKPRAQPRPKPVEPPPAAPSAGGAGQPAVVAVAPPPAPKGTEPPAPEIAAAAKEESNVVGNVSAVPADKQDAFRAAVDEAHSNYDKAVEHLKRSDPATNPDGWGRENKIALDLLTKAFDLYNKALDIFNDQTLWDRVRDTNFKRVLCRKRELMK